MAKAPAILDRGISFFFYVLLAALPLSKGIATVAMVALCLLSIAHLWVHKRSLWKLILAHKAVFALSLPFFAYALSLLYSQDLPLGLKFMDRELPLVLLPLLVLIHAEVLVEKVRPLLLTFVLAVCFNGLVMLLFYALPEESAVQLADRFAFLGIKPYEQLSLREAFGVYSPFMIRIQFSNLLALACLAGLWMGTQSILKPWQVAGLLAFLLLCSAILGGRGGQLGLMAGLAVWLLAAYGRHLHPRLVRKVGRVGSMLLLLGSLGLSFGAAPYLLYKHIPALNERYNQLIWELKLYQSNEYLEYDYVHFTSLRRLFSYQNSWELIQEHPLLGVGVGDYQAAMSRVYRNNHPEFPVNSHNHLLFLWANAGLLALLAFLAGMAYWLVCVLRGRAYWPQAYALSLLFFFLTILTLEAMLNQVDLMNFGLFLGWAALLVRAHAEA